MCPTIDEFVDYGKKLYMGVCKVCGKDRWCFESHEHTDCDNHLATLNKTPYTEAKEEWVKMRKGMTTLVYERDGEKCICCSSEDRLTIDHIVSLIDGGSNNIDNLQVLCLSCNSRKGRSIQ